MTPLELPKVDAPVLLMSYLNPLLAFGLDALAETAARANVAGFIVPDLPFDESDDLLAALEPQGLALVQMVTPVTKPERLKQVCDAAKAKAATTAMITSRINTMLSIPMLYAMVSYNGG